MIGESSSASEFIESYAGGQRNFRNANLSGLELKRAHLPEIDLQGAYLRWVDFQGANLKLANLPWADLQKANLSDATLEQAMLKEANLRKANLQWADLQEAQLQQANLSQSHLKCANFRGASLRLANLQAADLDKAELSGVDLRVANLTEAQLRNTDLKHGKLQGANLSKANLTGANLEGVNLQGADLRETKLFGANLQGANLQQVNLEGADLREAKLFGAILQGANLQKAILPSLENMQGACINEAEFLGSVLPKGQVLEKAILENGLICESKNAIKSLPPSTETEALDVTFLPADSESMKMPEISEAPDLILEAEQIPEQSEVKISDTIEPSRPNRVVSSDLSSEKVNPDAPKLLDVIQQKIGDRGHFTSTSLAIAKRRGPSNLRQQLLKAYQGCCSITGCNTEPILEVAFLEPNQTEQNTEPSNSLLLRADIHTLFDLHLIAIDPETLKVIVAPSLRKSNYGEIHGQLLRQTSLAEFRLNRESLQLRLQWCRWLNVSA